MKKIVDGIPSVATSVLQDWLFHIPYRMQSVLLSALRGCDTARKDDNSKFITRAIRSLLLNNADPSNSFIVGNGRPDKKYVEAFLWDLDSYPMHFVAHTAHAAEIIGYKHPDAELRTWWLGFYKDLVKGLHLNPEIEEQLDVRLGYTPAEEKTVKNRRESLGSRADTLITLEEAEQMAKDKVKAAKQRWDAGTGTSHGGRTREWSGAS